MKMCVADFEMCIPNFGMHISKFGIENLEYFGWKYSTNLIMEKGNHNCPASTINTTRSVSRSVPSGS